MIWLQRISLIIISSLLINLSLSHLFGSLPETMAQQSKKRKFSEIEQIDDVKGPLPNSSIHGAITSLSPIKPRRKSAYFDGMLADNSSRIRFVGFEPLQQKKLVSLQQQNVPVQIDNCEIKTARQGEGYEIMLKSTSQIS